MIYNINFATGKMEAIDESKGNKNNLPVGTILHLNGYNCPDYVVTNNRGIDSKWPHYGASYDCVNLDTGHQERKQAYTLEWLRDKKSNKIQVYITDHIMSQDEMNTALTNAQAAKDEIDRKAREEKERKDAERQSLPARFPYLTQGTTEKIAAANIRIELKRAFPNVKFSVTIQTRGTSSINIHWTDGPITEQVENVTGKYQEGHFNGMEDIYEYSNQVWTEIFGGARYVCENRHVSPELIKRAAKEYGFDLTTGESDNYGNLEGLDWEKSRMIYRQARTMAA